MLLNEVTTNLKLIEKVNKLAFICNKGYCDVIEEEAFMEDEYTKIEMNWKKVASPYIRKKDNCVVFINLLTDGEVINGVTIIEPAIGSDEEINELYDMLNSKKDNLGFFITSIIFLAFSIFNVVMGLIIGLSIGQFSNFFMFCFYMSPAFTLLLLSVINFKWNLSK